MTAPQNGLAVGDVLTSADPEPPEGTVVRDAVYRALWTCEEVPGFAWFSWHADRDGADPESWTKIAGNYGPVTVVEL